MSNEKVLEKLKGILNLANDNNSHPEESQNAMLMAQRLMAQHNLTMEDVEFGTEKEKKKEVVDGQITQPRKMAWWYKELANVIADNFKCSPYLSVGGGRTSVHFIGLKEDVEIAKSVYHYAASAIKYHSDEFVKKRQREGWLVKGIRNDYIHGFLSGLTAKFREQVKNEGWGLIIVKDEAVVEYVKGMNFRKGAQSSATRGGDNEARNAGFERGKGFNTSSDLLEN